MRDDAADRPAGFARDLALAYAFGLAGVVAWIPFIDKRLETALGPTGLTLIACMAITAPFPWWVTARLLFQRFGWKALWVLPSGIGAMSVPIFAALYLLGLASGR